MPPEGDRATNQGTCTKLVKFGRVFFLCYASGETDSQTDRQTDIFMTILNYQISRELSNQMKRRLNSDDVTRRFE